MGIIEVGQYRFWEEYPDSIFIISAVEPLLVSYTYISGMSYQTSTDIIMKSKRAYSFEAIKQFDIDLEELLNEGSIQKTKI
jgi:hypothetical protein